MASVSVKDGASPEITHIGVKRTSAYKRYKWLTAHRVVTIPYVRRGASTAILVGSAPGVRARINLRAAMKFPSDISLTC